MPRRQQTANVVLQLIALLTIGSLLVPGLTACARQSGIEEGQLTRTAVAARQQGRTTAVVAPIHEETGQSADLPHAALLYSFVLAGGSVKTNVDVRRDTVFTWYVLPVIRELSSPHKAAALCEVTRPGSVLPSKNELAIPLEFGTADIYGIDIRVESIDSKIQFLPQETYFLIVERCADGAARLPFGPFSVFAVGPNQTLTPLMTEDRPFIESVRQLGTVAQLEAYLQRSES